MCPPPASCPPPAYWSLGEEGWLERQPRCCVSTAQLLSKPWCVVNAGLAADAKHRSMRAAKGKVNSILAIPNTHNNETEILTISPN